MLNKKLATSALAALIFSLSAGAMQQGQSDQCFDQQAPCKKVEKIEIPQPVVSCTRLSHTVVYTLSTTEDIEREIILTSECVANQGWDFNNNGAEQFPQRKIAAPSCEQQNGMEQQGGAVCQEIAPAALSIAATQVYSGSKHGVLKTVETIKDRLCFNGGDARSLTLNVDNCTVSQEDFLLPFMNAHGFSMDEVIAATAQLTRQLQNEGMVKLRTVDNKRVHKAKGESKSRQSKK